MIESDEFQGISWRNTKRHFNKKTSPVGPKGPRLPVRYEMQEVKDPESHVHPRSLRTPKCSCGYPSKPCPFWDDDCTRNYCYKEHG